MPLSSSPLSASRRKTSRTSDGLPAGNRATSRAAVGVKSPTSRSGRTSGQSFSSQASRRQTQLLWPPSSSATSAWDQPVIADQRLDDPRLLQLVGPPAGLVEPRNGRLGAAIVDVDDPHQQRGHAADLERRLPAGEAVEHLGSFRADGGDDRRALAPAAERLSHGGDGLGHAEPIASELIAQLVQRHGTDLTDRIGIHRPLSGGNRRKEAGGPERLRDPPAPSSFWGRWNNKRPAWPWKIRDNELKARDRGVPVVNTCPAAALSPPPFPLEDAAQRLTARGAAKLLTRAAPTRSEWSSQPGRWQQKNAIRRWALALAGRLRRGAGGLRWGGERVLGGGSLATFGATTAITARLSLPVLPAILGLPIVATDAASPPSPSGGPALGTAICELGDGWDERASRSP